MENIFPFVLMAGSIRALNLCWQQQCAISRGVRVPKISNSLESNIRFEASSANQVF